MRLALSSAAAPGASLGELLDAAARRGLPGVELVDGAGHGHGLAPGLIDTATAAGAADRAAEAGLEIAGFRLLRPLHDPGRPEIRALERFAHALRAPLLVPLALPADGPAGPDGPDGAPREERWDRAVAAVVALHGGTMDARPLLPAGPAALMALDALDRALPGVDVAWDADPRAGDLGEHGTALLSRVGPRLRHVVLRGGGPEATEQEGRGVGSFMVRLAVSGYDGTVALAPSSSRYRVIWDAWLGRKGGWGCGSRSEDRTLVTLGGGQ